MGIIQSQEQSQSQSQIKEERILPNIPTRESEGYLKLIEKLKEIKECKITEDYVEI